MTDYLNTGAFWGLYETAPSGARRRALLAHFEAHPAGLLPVNNKWQAKSHDRDLAKLVRQGRLIQLRGGGSVRSPGHRSSAKRQSYLKLAPRSAAHG